MFLRFMDPKKPDALNRLVAALASAVWWNFKPESWKERDVKAFLSRLHKVKEDVQGEKIPEDLKRIFNKKTNDFFSGLGPLEIFKEHGIHQLQARKRQKGGQSYPPNSFSFHLFLELQRAHNTNNLSLINEIGEALSDEGDDGYIIQAVSKCIELNGIQQSIDSIFKMKIDIFVSDDWSARRMPALEKAAISYIWAEYNETVRNSFLTTSEADKNFFVKDYLQFCTANPLPFDLDLLSYVDLLHSPYFEKYNHVKKIALFKKSRGDLSRLDLGKEN